jgi:hypothetical protein
LGLAAAAAYASQILANARITENGTDVRADLTAAAAGQRASAKSFLSATLLSLIAELGQHHSLVIMALESAGSGHVANSLHYSGDAVDFGTLDGRG